MSSTLNREYFIILYKDRCDGQELETYFLLEKLMEEKTWT